LAEFQEVPSSDTCPSIDARFPSIPCTAEYYSGINRMHVRPFKNIHVNDTGVLLCPGKSMDMYKHKPVDKFNNTIIVASLNSGIYAPFNIDYMFIRHFFPDMHEAADTGYIKNEKAFQKFQGVLFIALDDSSQTTKILRRKKVRESKAKPIVAVEVKRLSKHIGNYAFGGCCSTVFLPLQFILYTGVRNLYIIGCDAEKNGYTRAHKRMQKKKNAGSYSAIRRMWKFSHGWITANYPEVQVKVLNPQGLSGIGWMEVYGDHI